jgi:predicted dehydrogenase
MNRRDFLKGVTLTSLGLKIAAEELNAHAQANPQVKAAGSQDFKPDDELKGRPVNCAVIGLGARGKEILTSLSKMGAFAPIVGICDTFSAPTFVKKAQAIAPKATFTNDYKKLLDDKTVEAVFIATPTHKHKQIVLDAIAAGKHVYCEAPYSNTIEEAKAIAQAGAAAKTIFQPGIQVRCNAQAEHVDHFIKSGALGKRTGGRAQYHERNSWRRTWPTSERETELNWRLNKNTSPGLLGEVGIHQLDTARWYFNSLPLSVTGYSNTVEWNDGRSVPDTVQCVVEYPGNIRFMYDATLTNSFDGAYELFFGSVSAIMLRDQRAWMFKEVDAEAVGWEVFARKDRMQIGNPEAGSGYAVGSGIALVADATKQIALGKTDLTNDPTKSSLYQACRVFLNSVRAGQRVPVKEPTKSNPNPPLAPNALDGYQATVVALKANEAAVTGSKIVFDKAWFTL